MKQAATLNMNSRGKHQHEWTSFVKTRLDCAIEGKDQDTLYFNQVIETALRKLSLSKFSAYYSSWPRSLLALIFYTGLSDPNSLVLDRRPSARIREPLSPRRWPERFVTKRQIVRERTTPTSTPTSGIIPCCLIVSVTTI